MTFVLPHYLCSWWLLKARLSQSILDLHRRTVGHADAEHPYAPGDWRRVENKENVLAYLYSDWIPDTTYLYSDWILDTTYLYSDWIPDTTSFDHSRHCWVCASDAGLSDTFNSTYLFSDF